MTFWPSAAMRACTCALAPLPMPTIAITAPTPIIIPSMVSAVRSLFRRRARNAILMVAQILMHSVQLPLFLFLAQPAQLAFGKQPGSHRRVADHFAVPHHDHAPGVMRDVQFMGDHDDGD